MYGGTGDYSLSDLRELSKIYSLEYNNPRFHDRVLVFDIIRDESQQSDTTTHLIGTSEINQRLESKSTESLPLSSDALKQNECLPSVRRHSTKNLCMKNVSDEMDNTVATSTMRSPVGPPFEIESESKHEYACDDVCFTNNKNNTAMAAIVTEVLLDKQNDKRVSSSSRVSVTDADERPLLKQHRIFVHASWLAVQSTYFQSLFFLEMKESTVKEVHLKIAQCEEKGHWQLIKAMYDSDVLNEVDIGELLVVLELADKYQVKFVFRKCKYVLKTMVCFLENCEKVMHVIKVKQDMADVDELALAVKTYLGKKFSPLDKTWHTDSFRNLSMVLLRSLLSGDQVTTKSENTVFHALMTWIESNSVDTTCENSTSPLLSLVRFEIMTLDYLYNVVQWHPIASKMECFKELYYRGITYHALTRQMREGLDMKHVERKNPNYYGLDEFVQYTWVIAKENLKTAQDTDELTSEIFWCCGYKMQLSLKKKCKTASNPRTNYVDMTLHVLGLSKTSDLGVKWMWKSDNIGNVYHYCQRHNYKFSENKPKSKFEVILKNTGQEDVSIDFVLDSLY